MQEFTCMHFLQQGDIDSSEESRTNNLDIGRKDTDLVCSICGCEDNENFETMIRPCSCNGGSALAHPSCISTSSSVSTAGSSEPADYCKVCGYRDTLNRGCEEKEPENVSRCDSSSKVNISSNAEQKGVTRLASDMFNSCESKKNEIDRKSPYEPQKQDTSNCHKEEQGVSNAVRKFVDTSAIPIKKRKLALFHPPSPPGVPHETGESHQISCTEPEKMSNSCDGALSQENFKESDEKEDSLHARNAHADADGKQVKLNVCQVNENIQVTSATSAAREGIVDEGSLSDLNVSMHASLHSTPESDLHVKALEVKTIKPVSNMCKTSLNVVDSKPEGLKQQILSEGSESKRSDCDTINTMLDDTMGTVSHDRKTTWACAKQEVKDPENFDEPKGCTELVLGMKAAMGESSASLRDPAKQRQGMLLRLNSYISDERLHWDLNTPMDSWEKSTEFANNDCEHGRSCQILEDDVKKDLDPQSADCIKMDLLASDVQYKSVASEQDMLSKGLKADKKCNAIDPINSSNQERDPGPDTSLRLKPDSIPGSRSFNLKNSASTTNNVSFLPESMVGNDINLSMGPVGECCQSTSKYSESSDNRPSTQKVVATSELPEDLPLIGSTQVDTAPGDQKIVECDKPCIPSSCHQVLEEAESVEATEVHNVSSSKRFEHLPFEKSCSPSSVGKDQHTESADDHRNGKDDTKCLADNATALLEKCGSPDNNSCGEKVCEETAYGGDTEFGAYDNGDDVISDSEKDLGEVATYGRQVEEGEYRGADHRDWIEEDVHEDLEDEHVDYGDSDCRDADDVGMELDDKEKDAENWDEYQQSEVEEYMESQLIEHINQSEDVLDVRDNAERESGCQTAQESHSGQEQHSKDNHSDYNTDLSKLRTAKNSGSRSKSSGWDQLPEGYKNAEEALKAVQDEIGKQGQAPSWPGGGQSGRISSRVSSSRRDRVHGERMDPDDSFYHRDGLYRHSRDGSIAMSSSFASRKPYRGRIAGRGGLSRGRGEYWTDGGRGYWNSGRRRSPEYYEDHAAYGRHRSANAAAMSAAKVESSGFIVAVDGTVTKVGRGGIRGRRGGRGSIMGRGSKMENEENMDFGMQMGMNRRVLMSDRSRDMGIGIERGNSGRHIVRERYRDPSFGDGRWDHPVGDSPPRRMMDHHRLRERNRSFTPPLDRRIRHMPRSHTESRSRSRTRSPRQRVSPRGGPGASIARAPPLRRRSRSPPFRSEHRPGKFKSAMFHDVGGSFDHKMQTHATPSRTRRSSPEGGSRWSFDRKDSSGHFKGSEFRRSFRSGSPSRRVSPYSAHDSFLDSPGRHRHGDYRHTVYPSRMDFNNDRRPKRDEDEDVRSRHGDRLGRVSSTDLRHYRHQDGGGEGEREAHNSSFKDQVKNDIEGKL
eukprot:TRINITY_DN8444_c0_g1_i2.p1 TRINITY_DN8444_c0_g1~~TRINITY_DN8444_c0_g1_i2.p1  ORF type:complete len:1388 (+),score=326.00 TRINITY_DN8444_c0_g1_i2:23-4186(+)